MWAVPALSAIENQAVASGIPTLIMNGGYDPVTPLAYGEAAAAQLSTHYLYEFPTMGHGSVWQNWIDDVPGIHRRSSSCASPRSSRTPRASRRWPPTDFLTTDDIYPTSAIYRFNSDVVEDRNPIQIGIAVLTICWC